LLIVLPLGDCVRSSAGVAKADWTLPSDLRKSRQDDYQDDHRVQLTFSNVGNLGERSADILVGFGAFVNPEPTRMSALRKKVRCAGRDTPDVTGNSGPLDES
jgi:hypothetical protein